MAMTGAGTIAAAVAFLGALTAALRAYSWTRRTSARADELAELVRRLEEVLDELEAGGELHRGYDE